tara:strand:+ start:3319 stop:4221 length:903 start_codon:yes stop_codon:yes gene_type:complete
MKKLLSFKKILILNTFFLSIFATPSIANKKILKIGAIPDQNQEILDRRFKLFSNKLSKELNVEVKYVPVVNYVAAVSGFKSKDLDIVWFGGLSGVQARIKTPNSIVLAQRDIDKEFKSVFIINKKLKIKPAKNIQNLKLLKNLRFTFGSENSTSGRLMPQHFLNMAGVKINDFSSKRASFSGSHDSTIVLVNSGAFEAGALNKQIWDRNLKENKKRTKNIKLFWVTPSYADYHWLAQGDLDKRFKKGFTSELKSIILNLDINNKKDKEILDMFGAKKFIESSPELYNDIENIARRLRKIR